MNSFWFALSLVALIYIIGGYVILFKTVPDLDQVFLSWSRPLKIVWFLFFAAGAGCFLAVQIILIFYTDGDLLDTAPLVSSYVLLLFSTTLWLPVLALAKEYPSLKAVVMTNVVITAISSVLHTVALYNVSTLVFALSLPLTVHCIVFDGLLWNYQYFKL